MSCPCCLRATAHTHALLGRSRSVVHYKTKLDPRGRSRQCVWPVDLRFMVVCIHCGWAPILTSFWPRCRLRHTAFAVLLAHEIRLGSIVYWVKANGTITSISNKLNKKSVEQFFSVVLFSFHLFCIFMLTWKEFILSGWQFGQCTLVP